MKKRMFLSKNWYFSVQKALIYYTFNKSHHNFYIISFSHVANFMWRILDFLLYSSKLHFYYFQPFYCWFLKCDLLVNKDDPLEDISEIFIFLKCEKFSSNDKNLIIIQNNKQTQTGC